jgi:predicted nucleic acid-binding protein
MKKVFIDSDVIVDFLTNRKPHSNQSAKVLNLCIENTVKGYISPVIVSNVYYVLRKKIDKQELKNKLKTIVNFLEVIVMNKKSILTALNSDFNDFEDALQNYAVESTDVKTIITRNVKDYKKSKLSVYTPDSFLKTLSND